MLGPFDFCRDPDLVFRERWHGFSAPLFPSTWPRTVFSAQLRSQQLGLHLRGRGNCHLVEEAQGSGACRGCTSRQGGEAISSNKSRNSETTQHEHAQAEEPAHGIEASIINGKVLGMSSSSTEVLLNTLGNRKPEQMNSHMGTCSALKPGTPA